MDRTLDEKLKEIVDLAKKFEVIQSSIDDKKRTLSMLESAAARVHGMPNVVEYANQASAALKEEIAEEEEQLAKLKADIHQ